MGPANRGKRREAHEGVRRIQEAIGNSPGDEVDYPDRPRRRNLDVISDARHRWQDHLVQSCALLIDQHDLDEF